MICGKEIDIHSDNYVEVTDYLRGKFYQNGLYHTVCYVGKRQASSELKTMAYNLAMKANNMLNRVEGGNDSGFTHVIK